ncbi:MAG: ATP-binding protein, partial [Chitinophagaceae bacterium]
MRFLPTYERIIVEKTDIVNIQKIYYISICALPITFLHVLLFFLDKSANEIVRIQWQKQIILAHTIGFFVSLVFAVIAYIVRKKQIFSHPLSKVLQVVFAAFCIAAGVSIATIDQLVTNSITPYLVASIVISVSLLMRPVLSVLLFVLAYLFFYYFLPLNQPNEAIMLSNRVNGLTFTGIALVLALVNWRNELRDIQNNLLIEKQKNDLLLANSTKDTFFSIIAHDLRGPINSMVALIDIIKNNETEGDEEPIFIMKQLSLLSKNTQYLLENLLKWAMLQKGQIKVFPAKVAIRSVFETETKLLENSAANKQVQFHLSIEENYYVKGDINLLSVVFRNLMNNAVKFSKPNSFINIRATKNDTCLTIDIIDEGVGMTDEQVKLLFKQ